MIYSLNGTLQNRGDGFVVIEVGGLGLKVFTHRRMLASLPSAQSNIAVFCHLHVREDALDLYGFEDPEELRLFELLISVSGVGPKSALSILDVAELARLTAAIQEGRADLLTQASGVGKKTAERIILDIKGKVRAPESDATVRSMETDVDILETLVGLGYRKEEARAALERLGNDVIGAEDRLRAALKTLSLKRK